MISRERVSAATQGIARQNAPELTFNAVQTVTVNSPEQLAAAYIFILPTVIDATWGAGAAERYRRACVTYGVKFEPVGTSRQVR